MVHGGLWWGHVANRKHSRMSRGCMEGVWRVHRGCMEGLQRVHEECAEGVQRVCRGLW